MPGALRAFEKRILGFSRAADPFPGRTSGRLPNPALAEHRADKRQASLAATEAQLAKMAAVAAWRLTGAGQIGIPTWDLAGMSGSTKCGTGWPLSALSSCPPSREHTSASTSLVAASLRGAVRGWWS